MLSGSSYDEQYKEFRKEQRKTYWENYTAKDGYKENVAKRVEEDRSNNWERQTNYKKQQVTCECGCVLTKGEMYRHVKSKRHLLKMGTDERGLP